MLYISLPAFTKANRKPKENCCFDVEDWQTGEKHRRYHGCLLKILDKGFACSNFLNEICNARAFCLPF
jgi:hypothetical protein